MRILQRYFVFTAALAICLFWTGASIAQNSKLDSLQHELTLTRQDDSNRVNLLNHVSKTYIGTDHFDEALQYAQKALQAATLAKYPKGEARACYYIGVCQKEKGNYELALEYHVKALDIRKTLGNKKDLAASYNAIGSVYTNEGDYSEGLKNFLAALKIQEEIGDKDGMAWSYNNIGVVNDGQKNYAEALRNYAAAIKAGEEAGDKRGVAWFSNNMGAIYLNQENYPEALKSFTAALALQRQIGAGSQSLAMTYNNIGAANLHQGNYDTALVNFKNTLELRREVNDKNGIAWSMADIGIVYGRQKKYEQGIGYLLEAFKLASEIKHKERMKGCAEELARLYAEMGNYKEAFAYHKLYGEVKDSLLNEESSRQLTEMQTKYQTEKKEQQIALLNKDKELQRTILWAVMLGSALVLVFAVFVFRSLRVTQKQKRIIEKQREKAELQRHMVEEKQKEILDSIHYAKRIQQSLLPSEKYIAKNLEELNG